MEQENFYQDKSQVEAKSFLHEVTPFSKYLALALFIVLPFAGGWIGYQYAPEEIIEVEKIVHAPGVTAEDQLESDTPADGFDYSSSREKYEEYMERNTIDVLSEQIGNRFGEFIYTEGKRLDCPSEYNCPQESYTFVGTTTVSGYLNYGMYGIEISVTDQDIDILPHSGNGFTRFTEPPRHLVLGGSELGDLKELMKNYSHAPYVTLEISGLQHSSSVKRVVTQTTVLSALATSTKQSESVEGIENTGTFTGYYTTVTLDHNEILLGYLAEGETLACDAFVITDGDTSILQHTKFIPGYENAIWIEERIMSDVDMQKLKQSSQSNQINVSITHKRFGDIAVPSCTATIKSLQVL